MAQKTVMRVNMNWNCPKCKREILKAVTKLSGIDQVTVDGEKGILTVIGDVDPVLVTTKVRNTGKMVEMVSVGPPTNDSPAPSKPSPLPLPLPLPPPHCHCHLVAISYGPWYDDGFCTIL